MCPKRHQACLHGHVKPRNFQFFDNSGKPISASNTLQMAICFLIILVSTVWDSELFDADVRSKWANLPQLASTLQRNILDGCHCCTDVEDLKSCEPQSPPSHTSKQGLHLSSSFYGYPSDWYLSILPRTRRTSWALYQIIAVDDSLRRRNLLWCKFVKFWLNKGADLD